MKELLLKAADAVVFEGILFHPFKSCHKVSRKMNKAGKQLLQSKFRKKINTMSVLVQSKARLSIINYW